MWNIIGLIVTIVALGAGVLFYVKSTKELRHIAKVIQDYLIMAVNNPDIKPALYKHNRIDHWNITIHPSGELK